MVESISDGSPEHVPPSLENIQALVALVRRRGREVSCTWGRKIEMETPDWWLLHLIERPIVKRPVFKLPADLGAVLDATTGKGKQYETETVLKFHQGSSREATLIGTLNCSTGGIVTDESTGEFSTKVDDGTLREILRIEKLTDDDNRRREMQSQVFDKNGKPATYEIEAAVFYLQEHPSITLLLISEEKVSHRTKELESQLEAAGINAKVTAKKSRSHEDKALFVEKIT